MKMGNVLLPKPIIQLLPPDWPATKPNGTSINTKKTVSYSVLIPREVHHGFMVTSEGNAILLNSPTRLYNPRDEGRDVFDHVGALFNDGTPFSWSQVRELLDL